MARRCMVKMNGLKIQKLIYSLSLSLSGLRVKQMKSKTFETRDEAAIGEVRHFRCSVRVTDDAHRISSDGIYHRHGIYTRY